MGLIETEEPEKVGDSKCKLEVAVGWVKSDDPEIGMHKNDEGGDGKEDSVF